MKDVYIPTFRADGIRSRNHSLETIARLEQLKRVIVQRNRRGQPVCAHFYGDSRLPLEARFRAGTKYSFKALHADHQVWELKSLPYSAANAQTQYGGSREDVDVHVRAMFLGVGRSILAKAA